VACRRGFRGPEVPAKALPALISRALLAIGAPGIFGWPEGYLQGASIKSLISVDSALFFSASRQAPGSAQNFPAQVSIQNFNSEFQFRISREQQRLW